MSHKKFSIVAAVDQSDQASLVLSRALQEAARHEAPEVHVVHVIDVKPKYADRVPIEETRGQLADEVQRALDAFAKPPEHESWCLHIHVRTGRPDEEIVALAHEARADLIAIGRHGESGRRHLFTGTVPEHLLRAAPCTVLVVQDDVYAQERVDQCADCVKLRHDSDGEVWFCEAHHSERPIHSMISSPFGSPMLHGAGNSGLF